ncbi:MAG TPA: cation-translocating P-type ATPase, partial [Halobacteriales archaeon]|nr:cation-translocating P-type ATPase [Halobacteriales archaeon]
MATCDLCDLPTPDPPVTAESVPGAYCCRGCLEVARTLDVDPSSAGGDVDAREVLGADGEADGEASERGTDEAGETAYLAVSGMHCATCEAFLEARATGAAGVLDAAASYSSGLVRLTYDPARVDPDDLPSVLSGTGYAARPADVDAEDGDAEGLGRLLVGGFFGMMVMLWYVLFLYPAYLGVPTASLPFDVRGPAGTYLLANVWVMATVVLGYTGYPQLRGAYVSLRAGYPNMDLLVALAATSAYVYSTAAVAAGRTEVYFDVVVAIVVVVALGNRYESRIRRRAAGHLAELTAARVDSARRRTAAGEERVAVSDLADGDEVVVKPGERVPVDGTVVEGTAAVDESLLTGEPAPQSRGPGDPVVAGSVATDGALVVAVDGSGEHTLDRLVSHLWAVQSGRAGVQRLADRLAAVFVPLAIALALVAAVGWWLLGGETPRGALLAGLSVLVVSCPCALGLATPLAVARGVREALGFGTVVTDAAVFERGAEVDVVALDKTGTLTTGEMVLLEVVGGDEVLRRAAAVEQFSEHPVAEAVTERAPPGTGSAADFTRHAGRGVSGRVDGEDVVVGRRDLLEAEGMAVGERLADRAEEARREGNVPALVGWAGEARGLLVAGDRPREGWTEVVDALADGREVVVITGDEREGAEPFASHPGISEVFAGVPPEAKAEVVARLRARGTVAMVGDGTNDASALAAADVGVAIERGAALAADAADVVVTTDDLGAVPRVLSLTRATRRRVRWNLAWAFGYNAVAVPLALAGLLNPLVAAAAMAGSSLLVVGNSSRRLLSDVDGGDGAPRE